MTNFDYSKNDLVNALKQSGLTKGDLVLIYTSMFQLGKLENANSSDDVSKIVLDSFLEAIGPTGTLLVPTYTYSFCKNQDFDVKNTPTTLGTFPEFFRKLNYVLRSSDPIFSVSGIGPKAKKILNNLPKSCFGKDSIYDRITRENGKLCVIGLGLSWATYRHFVEQKMKIPARFAKYFTGKIIQNGNERIETWEYFVRHLSDNCYPDPTVIEEHFRMANVDKICKKARVGRGEILSISCNNYMKFLEKEMQKDPWFSVRGPPNKI